MLKAKRVNIPELVGSGYGDFWKFKGRYRVVKGSRASKKSKTTALNFIVRLIQYPQANLLVIRKVFRTLKDSCYSDLKWAINRLEVSSYFVCKESPLEIMYNPTGQKILFRGLDDPLKIASISVDTGYLCWAWIEEAYEITKEEDFDMLDESIRGEVPENLFKQLTITFNPWNERHFLKRRFFDIKSDEVLSKTTNYMCNEWLDENDKKLFETMKTNNPRRYQVAGLGNWGVVEGLVYENWIEKEFDIRSITAQHKCYFGLDYGYTNDPTALFCGAVDEVGMKIYVFDEMYRTGMSNKMIAEEITRKGYGKEHITAESAEPKSNDNLRLDYDLKGIRPARKGKDSINNGIQFIQDYQIIIHPRCVNFITEISNYMWNTDKFGKKLNNPVDDFNHLMDAMRYAFEELTNRNKLRTINKSLLGLR